MRDARDDTTSDVVDKDKEVDDGYGRLTFEEETVVSDYTFAWWPASLWTRAQIAAEYGLTENADVVHISGPNNATIDVSHYLAFDGGDWKILSKRVTKGWRSRTEDYRLAMVALRVGDSS